MLEKIKGYYASPRITGEVTDCSMPMTFDTHSNCGFGCVYCFSTFQRGVNQNSDAYWKKQYKAVSVERFKRYFTELDNPKNPFRDLIKNRITLQFGGLSDPFCPIEEQEGTGYEILKFLKEINYPVCFSSKGDLILRDPKYLELFKGQKNWSYKATIITLDEELAKKLEPGTPTPQRRLEVLKALSDIGIWTILRLRPFIIGVSEKTAVELINKAADAGCRAMSTEFFCLEERSKNIAADKFKVISDAIGFDIVQYYKNISPGSGYLRLNWEIKKPYIDMMEEVCRSRGMNFHCSDAHHKERGYSGSCCGLPADGSVSNFSKCQFTYALQYAKVNGKVEWNDIAKHNVWMDKMKWVDAPGYNTGSSGKRSKFEHMTMLEYLNWLWNNPNNQNSPYKYFGGILFPEGLDKEGNIIYHFNPKVDWDKVNSKCLNCLS